MKKKKSLRERISYWFDRVMTKGPVAMSILLLAATTIIVGIVGIIAHFVAEEGNVFYQVWNSLMHTLDPGVLSGDQPDNVPYVFMMFLATLCGLCLTSVLISIISTGVENKLRDLRKGTSVVLEEDHTVVVGFDDNIYTLLKELIEANSNKKRACIVVLGNQPKEVMEDAIAAHIADTRTTTIICRSGKLHEPYCLGLCSVDTCKSVIVNVHDDAETVKVLLALSTYLKGKTLVHPDLCIVAYLQDRFCEEAARVAADRRAKIVCIQDTISRIIANTCRQHGLSAVLTELFNFGGHEMYIESIPALEGKTFHQALMSFANATAVGICDSKGARLNPPMDTVIGKGDRIVIIEEDDGSYICHPPKTVDESALSTAQAVEAEANDHLMVLGSNNKLPLILAEYNKYVSPHTRVTIVDNELSESGLGTHENLDINVYPTAITRDLLARFVDNGNNNMLLLNDDSLEAEASDSQTLLRLILLRDISDKTGTHLTITTEMCNTDNQRLAMQARVDDFVISTDFISLLMAQISEEPDLKALIDDLLDEDGSELYLKPAADYVPLGKEVDGYTVTESAARKGEIFVGYRRAGGDRRTYMNPPKGDPVTFERGDMIVVVSEN